MKIKKTERTRLGCDKLLRSSQILAFSPHEIPVEFRQLFPEQSVAEMRWDKYKRVNRSELKFVTPQDEVTDELCREDIASEPSHSSRRRCERKILGY